MSFVVELAKEQMTTQDEQVYTVPDFWDRPREGIANFRGQPHVYQSLFDDADDDWLDVYALKPIDNETFQRALQNWTIWLRWEAAFDAEQTTIETHPALPEDRPKHEALQALLQPRLDVHTGPAVRARGEFKRASADDQRQGWEGLMVRWRPMEP